MKILNRLIMLMLSVVMTAVAVALDLPVKQIRGEQYFYYTVGKGESVFGIAKHLGIGADQIVQHNPAAATGVRKGDILVFPCADFSTMEPQPSGEVPEADDTSISTAHGEQEAYEGSVADSTCSVSPEGYTPAVALRPAIAVLMPLGLEKGVPERTNKLALDFYKGMLIAADSLSGVGRNIHIDIVARDIDGMSAAAIADAYREDEALLTAAVVVVPEDAATISAVANVAASTGAKVLNIFNMRDSLYLTNPSVLQANIPQHAMYDQAAAAFMRQYEGYTPVILRSTSARNDKESFVEYIVERYRAEGVEPFTIEYGNTLLQSNLDVLPVAPGTRYVFLPSAGSLSEFNKFAHALRTYRDRISAVDPDAAVTGAPAVAEVFGYPDWTAFRGDALDTLHRLGATVYSRFFDDFAGFQARGIETAFKRWYGSPYIESIPSYGLLGYDVASYLIRNLRINDGQYSPDYPASFGGVQSTFSFVQSGSGYVNDALYIITYLPGGRVVERVE